MSVFIVFVYVCVCVSFFPDLSIYLDRYGDIYFFFHKIPSSLVTIVVSEVELGFLKKTTVFVFSKHVKNGHRLFNAS